MDVALVLVAGLGSTLITVPVSAIRGAFGALTVMVVALGIAVHRPLARVPENAMKLAVGILLSAFRCFWFGESFGNE